MTQTRTLEEIQADIEAEMKQTNGDEEQDDGVQDVSRVRPEEQEEPEADEEEQEEEQEVEEEEEPEDEEDDDKSEPQTDAEKAMALGWTPYQEYIDNGGDPEMYRGAKAFLQFYENRQKDKDKVKEKDTQLESLKDEMERLSQMMIEDRKKQREAFKKELEDKLKQQREDLDVEGFAETTEELKRLEGEEEGGETEAPQKEHPVIQEFRAENAVFDRESEKFNADANEMLESLVNQRLIKLAKDGVEVTERSLQKTIQEQSERVKRAFPETFGESNDMRRKTKRRKAPATAEQSPARSGKPSRKLDAREEQMYHSLVKQGRKAAADDFKRRILEA